MNKSSLPPRPTLMGCICIFHFPGVLSGSQLAFIGVVWFQSMMVSAMLVAQILKTTIHSTIFCHLACTTRRRKRPIDSLAIALPVMAKLLATYVQNMASEELAMLRTQKLWPKP
jgi:hypothetical protein